MVFLNKILYSVFCNAVLTESGPGLFGYIRQIERVETIARDMLNIPSFLISSPSLKFTIFLYLSPIGHFDIADPSSMQDACYHELSKYL